GVQTCALPISYELEAVDDALPRIVGRMAIRAEACFAARAGRVLERAAGRPGENRRVALDVIPRLAAEKLPDGHVERLAFQVPKGDVERAERMQLLAAGRIEVAAHHALPMMLDPEGVETDEHPRAFLHRPRLAAFADAHETRFGFDDHDVRGLIDHRLAAASLRVTGVAVVVNDFDAVLRQRRLEGWRYERAHARCAEPRQYAPSIPKLPCHSRSPIVRCVGVRTQSRSSSFRHR